MVIAVPAGRCGRCKEPVYTTCMSPYITHTCPPICPLCDKKFQTQIELGIHFPGCVATRRAKKALG